MEFQRSHQVSDNFHEITKHATTVTERYPLHCGLTVLHYSKRILMEFVLFLYAFLEEDAFELCYSGELKKYCKNIDRPGKKTGYLRNYAIK